MKRLIAIILLLQCFAAEAVIARQKLLMDFNWRFSRTDTTGVTTPNFNDGKWRVLNLPHDWSIESDFNEKEATGGGGGYLPTGVGWYRKHFVLPASVRGKKLAIEFDGVYQNSDVWINGHFLGRYPNGYMSFFYDITDFAKTGENIITVRVDNSRQPNTRWYSGSGIYRHVWLTITDPVHVAQWGTYIISKVDGNSSAVTVRTAVENGGQSPANIVLRTRIEDKSGKVVANAESNVSIPAKGAMDIEQKITVAAPQLWSLEDPYLYSAKTFIVTETQKVLDEVKTDFGIRTIEYDVNAGFLLNGKKVKQNGVCLHHDAGSVGAAVPEEIWVRRLKILKEMGCNAIRTSHNPVAPEFLDLCDRMGFLVQDELFDVWKSGKVKYDYNLYFDKWSQRDLVNFIRRDRNHPSIVMWSAGNEIGEQKQERGMDILKPLIETFHREDPTRPVTTGNDNIAADNGSAKVEFLQMLDVVGYNYVDRWHERRELMYSIDRHDHPDWKMIGTESVSIPGVRGNYYGGTFFRPDSSAIRPAYMPGVIRAEQLWKFVAFHDYVAGDFMWTGIDYLGEARWPNKNASSGVIDLCGFPKDGYYFYQSQWTSKPMVHVSPHWSWPSSVKGMVIPVLVYTNCDTVELFLNGKSFGRKSIEFPRQGNSGGWNKYDRPQVNITTGDLHLTWDVPYEPGTLKAVGRKNGKTIDSEIRTASEPSALRASFDRDFVTADARDISHLTIEVLDAAGNVVPSANNQIEVLVEGEGGLIGLDNGNPTDHTSMKSKARQTFNGLALAVVQSTGKPGTIRVKVSSKGLKETTVEIPARKSASKLSTVEDLK